MSEEELPTIQHIIDEWHDPRSKPTLRKCWDKISFPGTIRTIWEVNDYLNHLRPLVLNISPIHAAYGAALREVRFILTSQIEAIAKHIDKELPDSMVKMVITALQKGMEAGKIAPDVGKPLIAALEGTEEDVIEHDETNQQNA